MFLFLLNFLCAAIGATWRYFIPKAKKSVKGEIALITGTAQGIGRELAIAYASKGATVVCVDVQEKSNQETVKIIRDLGCEKAYAYTCDVSDYAKVLDMYEDVKNKVGNVSILINNAGIVYTNHFCEMSKTDIERNVYVNTMSHIWMIKAVLPYMLEKNYGHIVAVGSMSTFGGVPYIVPYCVSKYAIEGLMNSLQKELALYKDCQVKFTTVHPYFADTQMVAQSNIKIPKLIPLSTPKYVAEAIMNAQRRELVEATVPQHYLYLRWIFRSISPKCSALIYKYLNIELQSPSSS